MTTIALSKTTIQKAAFIFFAASFLFGCKKTVPTDGPEKPQANSAYYFKGTLNTTLLNWQVYVDDAEWGLGSTNSSSLYNGISIGGLSGEITAIPRFKPEISIEFKTFRVSYDEDKSAYFKNFVSVGPITYSVSALYTVGTKDIAVRYTDSKGKVYTSIGSQTGSTANIVEINHIPAEPGTPEYLRIKITFSCKLYPSDNTGSTLALTGAEAILRLENQL
jgi:hypothetical protein